MNEWDAPTSSLKCPNNIPLPTRPPEARQYGCNAILLLAASFISNLYSEFRHFEYLQMGSSIGEEKGGRVWGATPAVGLVMVVSETLLVSWLHVRPLHVW